MSSIVVSELAYAPPGADQLFFDVSFGVAPGEHAAIVGANGVGKSTILRILSQVIEADDGEYTVNGNMLTMTQEVGMSNPNDTLREMLVEVAPKHLRTAGRALITAEKALADGTDDGMGYATALSDWGDLGGYELESDWQAAAQRSVKTPVDDFSRRLVSELSGGERKRLVLDLLLTSGADVLFLDEPDNYLDVPAKRWLENELINTTKTVFFVSHDRELLNKVAQKIVTVELGATGNTVWVHGGNFGTWHDARKARNERFAEMLLRWEQEHQRLIDLVKTLQVQAAISPDMANKYHAMQTRLRKFEEAGAPEAPPVEQDVKVGLRGGRTGLRALTFENVAIANLTEPFNFEVFFGDRIAVLGKNGTGKSHFFRMISGDSTVKYTGNFKVGARVEIGYFAQTHSHPEFEGKSLLEILWETYSLQLGPAKSVLRRYEIDKQAEQKFTSLSGGQQARFQILLLELSGSTLLLLDEPTDNLDLASAESLERALDHYEGTVLSVTHDRWFTRGFTRFLIFGANGQVYESPEPVFDH